MRGRPTDDSQYGGGSKWNQKLEANNEQVTYTLTTNLKDNLILEIYERSK